MVSRSGLIYLVILLSSVLAIDNSCETDDDCRSLNYCQEGECTHKDLFSLEPIEIVGTLVILIMSSISNAAGIGGGPVMTPILILLFYFDTHYAIPLSQVVIFGGSLIAIALKLSYRHPEKDRPLIYYELVMHVQSFVLLGTTLGVILNAAFPSWLILALLTILLIYISIKTFRKGKGLYHTETQKKKSTIPTNSHRETPGETPEEAPGEAPGETPNEDLNGNAVDDQVAQSSEDNDASESYRLNSPSSEKLEELLSSERKFIPYKWVAMIVGIYVIVIIGSFMKGGKGADSIIGIENCSENYYLFLGLFSLVLIGLGCFTGYLLLRLNKNREEAGYDFHKNDIKWNLKDVVAIGAVGLVAGLGAGMLGIGGGIVMNPVMLELGLLPEVSTASSSFMILFTSSIAIIQYLTADMVDVDYGIWVGCLAVVGSAIGVLVLKKLVTKYQRSSLLVLLLAVILAVAAIVIASYGIYDIIDKEEKGEAEYGFSEFC